MIVFLIVPGDHRYVVAYTLKPVDATGNVITNDFTNATIKQSPSTLFNNTADQYAGLQSGTTYGLNPDELTGCPIDGNGAHFHYNAATGGFSTHQPDILSAPPVKSHAGK